MLSRALKITVLLLCLLLSLTACADNGGEDHTLLIYMCGSDLESSRGYASQNLEEILSANLPNNVNIVIQTGGSESWHNPNISSEHIGRYEVKNSKLTQLSSLPQENMGDGETLLSFLSFAKDSYPSDKTSLILWDHGGGTLGGVCFDENYGLDSLSLNELEYALDEANIDFEFIGFDACLMATYDTANSVKSFAKYMIASEELEPASGWDYKALLENLSSEDFYTEVLATYAKRQSAKTYYTLSVIDLSGMTRVDKAIDDIIESINGDISQLTTALEDTIFFGTNEVSKSDTNLLDLCLFARSLGIECDFSDFIKTVGGSARADATGLSIYFPAKNEYDEAGYLEISKNSKYTDFLSAYTGRIPENPIVFDLDGFINNGRLSFSLTEQSLKYVQSVSYELHIYSDSGNEIMYYVGEDNDITRQHALYTVNFSGEWVYLNDLLLHCNILEENQRYTVFYAPVIIEDEYCYLIFSYIAPTKRFITEGYVEAGDIGSRINPLTSGCEITVIYEISDGTEEITYYEEGTVIFGSDTQISKKPLEADYYQCVPRVTDILGNEYYGKTAIIHFDGEKSVIESLSAG